MRWAKSGLKLIKYFWIYVIECLEKLETFDTWRTINLSQYLVLKRIVCQTKHILLPSYSDYIMLSTSYLSLKVGLSNNILDKAKYLPDVCQTIAKYTDSNNAWWKLHVRQLHIDLQRYSRSVFILIYQQIHTSQYVLIAKVHERLVITLRNSQSAR